MIKPEKLKDVLGAMRSLGSNLQAFEDIAGDLKWLANSLETLVGELEVKRLPEISKPAAKAMSKPAAKEASAPKSEITLEQVRSVLADKSRDGHTAAIRELLLKHGAVKLSGIDPAEYPSLLKEAEVLGNG